jgi:2-C-methyl-D-erythritol 4-phosphate cytidylyltransferase
VVLVPAAGRGERLGVGAPKALRQLGGEPLLVHAVRRVAAASSVAAVVVAAPPGESSQVRDLLKPVVAGAVLVVVDGGATRQASVALALAAVPGELPIVLVHDAARPLTPSDLVDEVAAAVRAGHPAVVPVLPVVDTIRRADGSGVVDRSTLLAVQTPQGFARSVLTEAHRAATDDASDDAGLAERIGIAVHTVPGRDEALKVTRPFDLLVAEALLASGAAR